MDNFPAFRAFVTETGLIDSATGNASVQIPRILGQGTTKTVGMATPPSLVESQMELIAFPFPKGTRVPDAVLAEVEAAREAIHAIKSGFKREEGRRRFAVACLEQLDDPKGQKDGQFYAGRLVLKDTKDGMEWAWSVTPHYDIVSRMPPDPAFVARAHVAAVEKLKELTLPVAEFEFRLELAWMLAQHRARSVDVLVVDVMRMYTIAGQDEKFWQSPRRLFFRDIPEAGFVVNLISWRAQASPDATKFEFVPATLHQTKDRQVFYMPMNAEGTDVRPMKYLRRKS